MDKKKLKVRIRHFTLLRWVRGLLPVVFIISLLVFTLCILLIITVGLPSPVLRILEKKMEEQQGLYFTIDRARLDLFNGMALVARGINIYESPVSGEEEPVLKVGRARLDFSIDNIWSGNLSLNDLKRLEVKDASVSIPMDRGGDCDVVLNIDEFGGEVILQSEGIVDFDNLSWEFVGIDFQAKGRILVDLEDRLEKKEVSYDDSLPVVHEEPLTEGLLDPLFIVIRRHKESILAGVNIRDGINFHATEAPRINLVFEANTEDITASRATIELNAPLIESKGYRFNNVELKANYQLGALSVERCFFRDSVGYLSWEGFYNFNSRLLVGRIDSSILWNTFRETFLNDSPLPYGLSLTHPVGTNAQIRITLDESWKIKDYLVTGTVSSRNIQAAGLDIRRVNADFSLKNGDYYIDNLVLEVGESSLSGKVMGKGGNLKLDLKSNISLQNYLTLAKELGAEIILPDDLTISGIPAYEAKVELQFPGDVKGDITGKCDIVIDCQQFIYKDNELSKTALSIKAENFSYSLESGKIRVTNGQVNLTGESFSAQGVVIKSLECDSSFEELLLFDEKKPFSMTNGYLNLRCADLVYKDVGFNKVALDLYYKDGEAYIPRLAATTKNNKELRLAAMIKDNILTAKAHSTLFLNEIAKLSERDDAHWHNSRLEFLKNGHLEVDVDFRINIDGWDDYEITGKASGLNVRYNGVPVESASTQFRYIPRELTLNDVKLIVLYTGYEMPIRTKVQPSPSKGTFTAKSIVNDESKSTVRFDSLSGRGYPELVLRMFAGQHISDQVGNFTFYQPPSISVNGTVDIKDPNMSNTNLRVNFNGNRVDYTFLGKPLNLYGVSGEVHISGQKLHLNRLRGNVWGGMFDAQLGVKIAGNEGYNGSIRLTKCNLKQVGQTFGVSLDDALANANIDFEMPGNNIRQLRGSGKVELAEGNLMTIPFFGPLSTLLNQVFKYIPGFSDLIRSQIRWAACDFEIRDGKLVTNNFLAKGGNLNIRGSGNVDLEKVNLNMDVRVDLKSLIGIVINTLTLPTLPFGGVFVFHGEGPLDNTSWGIRPFSEDYKGN